MVEVLEKRTNGTGGKRYGKKSSTVLTMKTTEGNNRLKPKGIISRSEVGIACLIVEQYLEA
ncbi:hypothetical protein RvY_08445 [Ramazzottius varieornatus]|uniref:Uncharacterized protein n=1 Tax=Ramazzottius varieornatus TaxID=947166 RepID=A0A1D1V857_RAMVA|nr:hypothetical protein RvY_08445 [Ramazzottius varieornatus]